MMLTGVLFVLFRSRLRAWARPVDLLAIESSLARHPAGRLRIVAPDDDPQFLWNLDRIIRGG